jgi:hypothetical protein
MRRLLGVVAVAVVRAGMMFGDVGHAQGPAAFQVGSIDFFGGQGRDTAALLAKLPVKVGQALKEEQMEALQSAISVTVQAAMGKPSTDVAVMCCDEPGELQLYVGLQGSSYRAPRYAAAPTGVATLPDDGVGLYRKYMEAFAHAVQSGNSQEDDSKGYALTKDSAAHAIELTMREYALKHGEWIQRVLGEGKDAEQREAAAALLGYGERSEAQINELAQAADDPDSEVRNNAVRALEVLAAAAPLVGLHVEPFVTMLYSGQWTDRNKASLLLARMTEGRDGTMLRRLRDEAMGPLLDGAKWQSAGHAYAFLLILGRIGGIDEGRLGKMIESGERREIVAAVQKH